MSLHECMNTSPQNMKSFACLPTRCHLLGGKLEGDSALALNLKVTLVVILPVNLKVTLAVAVNLKVTRAVAVNLKVTGSKLKVALLLVGGGVNLSGTLHLKI